MRKVSGQNINQYSNSYKAMNRSPPPTLLMCDAFMCEGAKTPTRATRGTGAVLPLLGANVRTSLADERSARNTRLTTLRGSHPRIVRASRSGLKGTLFGSFRGAGHQACGGRDQLRGGVHDDLAGALSRSQAAWKLTNTGQSRGRRRAGRGRLPARPHRPRRGGRTHCQCGRHRRPRHP